jgi:polar amino acid transport system ATP-binding protein
VITNETLIKVENMQKAFGKVEVLKGINTEIKKGEVVCIIGPSGSGKSTFLRTLNLLESPTGGSIIFDGADITAKGSDINQHRMKMGMVFQQFNLFPHMTVLKNMTIAPIKLLKLSKAEAEEIISVAKDLLDAQKEKQSMQKLSLGISGTTKEKAAQASYLNNLAAQALALQGHKEVAEKEAEYGGREGE